MASRILYNTDDLLDAVIVLEFIDAYTYELGVRPAFVDGNIVMSVVNECKRDFPHKDGLDKASAFKQAAHFVCYFISKKPILDPFPVGIIGEQLAEIPNHQNAIVAFAIAETALNNSMIRRKDGDIQIKNPIRYSRHSYIDIIEALSEITPSPHFKLTTVLFEQLVYKSNPGCQYPIIDVEGTGA